MTQNKHEPISNMEATRFASSVNPTELESPATFKQYRDLVSEWFNDKDYETRMAFEQSWNHMVSEDYDGVDVMINLIDLIYEHCYNNNTDLSMTDKRNLKNLKTGIQHTISSMKQYNNKETDKILVASLVGYLLKVTRNFYHD